jgi:hypothetical protein
VKAWLALLIGMCSIGAAFADAPKTSIRPMPRPVLAQPDVPQPDVPQPDVPQPILRETLQQAAITLPATARIRPQHRPVAITKVTPDAPSPRAEVAPPKPRRGLLSLLTPRAKPAAKATASRKGSVCGVPSIKGKTLPRVTSKTKGCGIAEPVSVTSVDGAKLSTPATIDCNTAIALNTWVQKGLRPAFPNADIASLTVVDSYSCRPRNNVRGNKLSEHAKGHAIDVSGVTFTNGKTLTVARNFKTLRRAYKAGCGIFGTTLGPGSDGYHEDHMHFDTARQRGGGAYCR